MKQGHRINNDIRDQIMDLSNSNYTYKQIEEKLGISKTVVHRTKQCADLAISGDMDHLLHVTKDNLGLRFWASEYAKRSHQSKANLASDVENQKKYEALYRSIVLQIFTATKYFQVIMNYYDRELQNSLPKLAWDALAAERKHVLNCFSMLSLILERSGLKDAYDSWCDNSVLEV